MGRKDEDWRVVIMRFTFRQGYLTPGIQFLADDRHGDGPSFWVDSCADPFVLRFDTIAEAVAVLQEAPDDAVLTCVNVAEIERYEVAQERQDATSKR
jgi:hypothetical protein